MQGDGTNGSGATKGMSFEERSAAGQRAWRSRPEAVREAQINLLTGLWRSDERRGRMAAFMHTEWDDFKDEDLYETLLQDLRDAQKGG
jgi:hypothetical protein